jgi:hypothetical protein
MQIIILGMHRSGTSLVTRMVNMMGPHVGAEGSLVPADNKDNPTGYWEHKDLMRLNIELLRLHNVDWAGYNVGSWPIPFHHRDVPPPLHQQMKALILGMDNSRPWVMKDPRMCLTLPYWKPLLEVPVYVIVYRDPLEIAQSLHKRKDLPISIERAIALWELYAVSLLNAAADAPRVFISHSDFLYDPVSTAAQLYHGLAAQGIQGLRQPTSDDITAFIDPKLHRSKPGARNLSGYQEQLADMMRGDYNPERELTVSESSRKILQQPLPVI